MKTSELTGALLDYWVARAEGHNWRYPWMLKEGKSMQEWQNCEVAWGNTTPLYSTEWSQGGPIIEREKIEILHPGEIFVGGEWTAGVGEDSDGDWAFFGQASSPLVAEMRAYVSSKFGDEVDSPQTYQQEK